MKKFLLLFCVALSSTFCTMAQSKEISIGVRGGLSIPKIKASGDNPMSQGYSSRLSGGGGVFAEFQLSELFSLRPGIEFSGQGGNRDGMQAIPTRMLSKFPIPDALKSQLPDYLYADFNSKTSFNYLMVPLYAQVGWNLGKESPFRIYLNGGPFVSFLLSANQTTSGNSQIYLKKDGSVSLDQMLAQYHIPVQVGEVPFNTDESIKSQTNSFNWGLGGNVGLAYQMGRHRIFVEGGGSYGFNKLQKSAENGENRIGVGTVMVGYAYQLK